MLGRRRPLLGSDGGRGTSRFPRQGASAGRKVLALVCGLILATLLGLVMAPSAQAAPVQFYYIPFPEAQLLTAFRSVAGDTTPSSPITSYITITAVGNGTIIYYDQWENGYDIDIANTLNVYSSDQPRTAPRSGATATPPMGHLPASPATSSMRGR